MKIATIALGLILCVISSAGAATKVIKPVFADLDGDGKKEKISITSTKDPKFSFPRYTINVGKAKLPVAGEEVDSFAIVDINRADHYKEIDIKVYSGGDVPIHFVCWYDGKSIRELDVMHGGVNYPGNGIVLNSRWNCYVWRTEKYVLDKERKLDIVPQEIYYVGKAGKVSKSFPIFYSRTSKDIVANLETDSKITILGYAPNYPTNKEPEHYDIMQDWILIKTQFGLLGWAQLKTVSQYVEGMQGAG